MHKPIRGTSMPRGLVLCQSCLLRYALLLCAQYAPGSAWASLPGTRRTCAAVCAFRVAWQFDSPHPPIRTFVSYAVQRSLVVSFVQAALATKGAYKATPRQGRVAAPSWRWASNPPWTEIVPHLHAPHLLAQSLLPPVLPRQRPRPLRRPLRRQLLFLLPANEY